MTQLPFRGVQTLEICVVSKLGINKAHLTVPPPLLHFINRNTLSGDGGGSGETKSGDRKRLSDDASVEKPAQQGEPRSRLANVALRFSRGNAAVDLFQS